VLVALGEAAVVDHDAVEVAPLGHVLGQAVLLSDLGLALLDLAFDRLY
jgi:hypothetical protein